MTSDEIRRLQDQVGQLNVRLEKAERERAEAKGEAHEARERVLELRDQVVAAQRDQQELRTARARLRRFAARGVIARLFNQERSRSRDGSEATGIPNRVSSYVLLAPCSESRLPGLGDLVAPGTSCK